MGLENFASGLPEKDPKLRTFDDAITDAERILAQKENEREQRRRDQLHFETRKAEGTKEADELLDRGDK